MGKLLNNKPTEEERELKYLNKTARQVWKMKEKLSYVYKPG
jgi:hypothetical protein